MTLDILVPQYKENEKIISHLLNSISNQKGIDFKNISAILTNDGSDVILNAEFLNSYPFTIKYFKNENKGVSATRNYCLINSNADYVMFCDTDDEFYHNLALYQIFLEIEKSHCDLIFPAFLEESHNPVTNTYFYSVNKKSFNFIHGKVYNRHFLLNNKIFWDETLTLHEDTYFNGLVFSKLKDDRITYIKDPYYLWCYNSNSISRQPNFVFFSYLENIRSVDRCCSKIIDINGNKEVLKSLVVIQLYQTYMILNSVYRKISETNIEFNSHLNKIEKSFYLFYTKYKSLYKQTSIEVKKDLYNKIQKSLEDIYKETSTIDDNKLQNFNGYLEKLKEEFEDCK